MDDRKLDLLQWTSDRRFGIEIELNAFDGRNRPENKDALPAGIESVGELVSSVLTTSVNVLPWQHTHNNNNWIIKPDSSCGMEVCSPVLKGWKGLEQVVRCAEAFNQHKIKSDHRCSLHVHVNVHDCSKYEVASMVAHWIKCEAVFIDSVPANRKRSRYCQVVGLCDMFDIETTPNPQNILDKMGQSKYFTLNNHHFSKDMRSTIEFRIAENDACIDPIFVKNWARLVVHFCDMAKKLPVPPKYEPGKPWTSLCWLDPIDVFRMLGFLPGQYDLSPGLCQVRDWFLARIITHMRNTGLPGAFSVIGRNHAWEEVQKLVGMIGFNSVAKHLGGAGEDITKWLYSKELSC